MKMIKKRNKLLQGINTENKYLASFFWQLVMYRILLNFTSLFPPRETRGIGDLVFHF